MSRLPWLRMRKKTDPELPLTPPIRLGNFSNGEFFHEQTPLERRIECEILVQVYEKARKLGMERRDFLASAMGMATSLSVLNLASGCTAEGSSGSGGAGGSGTGWFLRASSYPFSTNFETTAACAWINLATYGSSDVSVTFTPFSVSSTVIVILS